jgi:hypothetical protein
MDRENIALTVGGVMATMALAYWFFLKQQRDAAAAASSAQADAIAASDSSPAADPYNNQLTEEWLASNLTSASGVALTGLSSNTAASVSTSAAVSDLGAPYDSTDTAHLLSDIVANYSGAPSSSLNLGGASSFDLGAFDLGGAGNFNPGAAGSLKLDSAAMATVTLPELPGVVQTATGNIPVSAADAIAQAELALSPSSSSAIYAPVDSSPWGPINALNGGQSFNSFLASMQSGAGVTSHPVSAHPIVTVGV